MFINAAFAPGIFYEQTLTVVPNTNYEFSISVINLIANNASILPNINLEIDRLGVDDNNNGTVDEAGESQVIALTGNIPNSNTPHLARVWRCNQLGCLQPHYGALAQQRTRRRQRPGH